MVARRDRRPQLPFPAPARLGDNPRRIMSNRCLLFIAGPMAVGKSTLISRLIAGELEDVRRRLGLDATETWHVLDKSELPALRTAQPARTILCHYDILEFTVPTLRSDLEALARVEACRVVTLWATPGALQERMVKRDFHGQLPAAPRSNWHLWSRRARVLPRWLRDYLGRHFIRRGSVLARFMRRTLGITPMQPAFHVLERYRNPDSVAALYESWRELCVANGAEQLFIDTTDGSYRFVERPPWYDVSA